MSDTEARGQMPPRPQADCENRSLERELEARLEALERAGLARTMDAARREPGALIHTGGRTLVDFASNDYLGLATDPRLAEAAARALADAGVGAGAARLISGTHPLHAELERELAAFMRAPAALLFNSGYAANTGVIPALAGRGDVIYSDQLNHASLIDGCRLSRAQVRIFPHRDLDALVGLLEADRGRGGARWIVAEGVYSMEGDAYPLDELADLARHYGAWTYVDDAHGVGVLGECGRGTAELAGVEGRIDVTMATLGKAFGVAGAFVAGSESLRRWLLNRGRPFVFATALPPALAAAALAALEIVRGEPERRRRLASNAALLRNGLRGLGMAAADGPGHITPVRLGGGGAGAPESSVRASWTGTNPGAESSDDMHGVIASAASPAAAGSGDQEPSADAAEVMRVGRELARRGYAVGTIRPPSVPRGGSRLRITVSAAHSPLQIAGLVAALGEALGRAAAGTDAAEPDAAEPDAAPAAGRRE